MLFRSDSAGKVSGLVSEIAAASSEQAKGIEQVNVAVSQMDKVTQGNAATAEESASASEELNAQARTLNEVVDEMVRLVNGANAAQGSSQHFAAAHNKGSKSYRPAHHAPAAAPALTHTNGSASHTKAEEAIPFDEDDLKNF